MRLLHRHVHPRAVTTAACLLVVAGTVSCSSVAQPADGRPAELIVFAASSLTDAFADVEQIFEAEHPEVEVEVIVDSSSTLAEQVVAGAPADVLATADEATMQRVTDEGLAARSPVTFARNQLTLVTPADDRTSVQSAVDLERDGVTYAVCVPDAPCGAAARALLDLLGVDAEPVTEEDNVRAVLTKVTAGEVDAGLVYVSDAEAAGADVGVVDLPRAGEVLTVNRITALSQAAEPELARDWVTLVSSAQGQRVLASYGFLPAP